MTSTLSLRSPVDLLAAVPYLLGFHPADSVVLLGLDGRRVNFQARADLSTPAGPLASQLAELFARQGLRQCLIVGYGPAGRVDPVVGALRERLTEVGIAAPEALRVAGGRYWSYTCTVPACCPPDGNPFVLDTSAVPAQATVAGLVALPSREALRQQLAPVDGAARESMRRATERADARASALVDAALGEAPAISVAGGPAQAAASGEVAVRAAQRRFESAGRRAVDAAVRSCREGQTLTDDAAAWLSVLLVHRPVRDHAWNSIGADLRPQLALWTDLTRRAETDLRAAPAALLAFTAWRAGEGATSTIALEVALDADPEYSMARLLGHLIGSGIDPERWDEFNRPPRRLRRRRQ